MGKLKLRTKLNKLVMLRLLRTTERWNVVCVNSPSNAMKTTRTTEECKNLLPSSKEDLSSTRRWLKMPKNKPTLTCPSSRRSATNWKNLKNALHWPKPHSAKLNQDIPTQFPRRLSKPPLNHKCSRPELEQQEVPTRLYHHHTSYYRRSVAERIG